MSDHVSQFGDRASRRNFLQATSVLVGGAVLGGVNAKLVRAAHPGGSDEIKIALIGCGSRGTGAATQALATKGKVTLWAMADAFADNLQACLKTIEKQVERGRRDGDPLFNDSKIDVAPDRQFVGFDAYRRALESDVDLIILATPPGFRPVHFDAAVAAGKHIFMEKPVAVDGPGVRKVLATNEIAKQKNLMVAVGLQRRHDPRYVESIKRVHDGAIGDVISSQVYWNGGPIWVRPRLPQQTEMEYQMRNWYYFTWLCGDHIVEQHIHNLDVGTWLHQAHPISAQGMGGRQVRTGKEFGQIFDHHAVEYTFADGSKMFSQCRQIEGCITEVRESAQGTKGKYLGAGAGVTTASGKWAPKAIKLDAHHQEHIDLFAQLRAGKTYNEVQYGAESTMTAILGRLATYSGKVVTWDDALNRGIDLSPKEYDFAATPSVLADANGFYPAAVPGVTEVLVPKS